MEKIEHNQRNIGHSVFPALVYFCCQFFNKDNQYDNSKQKMDATDGSNRLHIVNKHRRRKLVLTMQ